MGSVEIMDTQVFTQQLFGSLTAIVKENGDVFFISNEVSAILGYAKNANMLDRIDQDDILKLSHSEANSVFSGIDIHSSGIQLLSESGLYAAILGSEKTEAKTFKKWVTSEVLPAIRKTGTYNINTPKTFREALLLAAEQQLQIELQQAALLKQAEKLDELNSYASILRVAIHNKVDETLFNWRALKLYCTERGLAIKKVPCPRFKSKNLYPIDAYKTLYADYKLNFDFEKEL